MPGRFRTHSGSQRRTLAISIICTALVGTFALAYSQNYLDLSTIKHKIITAAESSNLPLQGPTQSNDSPAQKQIKNHLTPAINEGTIETSYNQNDNVISYSDNNYLNDSRTASKQLPNTQAGQDNSIILAEATDIVQKLYSAQQRADQGLGPTPFLSPSAQQYFTADAITWLQSGQIDAHPLYGAQDYEIKIRAIAADPTQPIFRGMITIHVDFTNFGQTQRATYYLRADTEQNNAPLRIFRVEHNGWSYP